jgi:hypothetical protein
LVAASFATTNTVLPQDTGKEQEKFTPGLHILMGFGNARERGRKGRRDPRTEIYRDMLDSLDLEAEDLVDAR